MASSQTLQEGVYNNQALMNVRTQRRHATKIMSKRQETSMIISYLLTFRCNLSLCLLYTFKYRSFCELESFRLLQLSFHFD